MAGPFTNAKMANLVTVKVLKRGRAHGRTIYPGDVVQLPEHVVTELIAQGIVERLSPPLFINTSGLPDGARLVVKLPEEG